MPSANSGKRHTANPPSVHKPFCGQATRKIKRVKNPAPHAISKNNHGPSRRAAQKRRGKIKTNWISMEKYHHAALRYMRFIWISMKRSPSRLKMMRSSTGSRRAMKGETKYTKCATQYMG